MGCCATSSPAHHGPHASCSTNVKTEKRFPNFTSQPYSTPSLGDNRILFSSRSEPGTLILVFRMVSLVLQGLRCPCQMLPIKCICLLMPAMARMRTTLLPLPLVPFRLVPDGDNTAGGQPNVTAFLQ